MKNKHSILFWSIFVLFAIAYYVFKYLHPAMVETHFNAGNFALLNRLTESDTNLTLGGYLGRAEEYFFGPFTQIISGFLFVFFSFAFLKNSTARQFGFAVFVYLVLTKFEVLFFPLYGDAIGGPFAEGLWLAKNNFNYAGLFNEPGYAQGGPKVYFFSIFPTYLAVMMKIIPNTKAFLFVNHLVFFAIAAVITALLKEILQRVFDPEVAILGSILVMILPLFQSQTEAINMELSSVVFMMLAARALINHKIDRAGVYTVAALLVKGTGVIACAAYFCTALFMFFTDYKLKYDYKPLVWGGCLMMLAWLKLSSKYLLNDQHVSVGMVTPLIGWASLKQFMITYVFIGSAVIFLAYVIYKKFDIEKRLTVSVMFIYGLMWFMLFLNFYAVSSRYRVAAYPFIVFCALYAASLIIRHSFFQKCGIIAVMIAALWGSYGRYFHPIPENDFVLLERSLEYRTDLKLNQQIAKTIEDDFSHFKIGAPFLYAQMLAIPEAGYVKKNLDVMIYGFNCTYGGITAYPGMANLDVGRTIYVGVKVVQLYKGLPYPVHPNDRIIKELEYGNKKAWLFMGGISIEALMRRVSMIKLLQMRKLK